MSTSLTKSLSEPQITSAQPQATTGQVSSAQPQSTGQVNPGVITCETTDGSPTNGDVTEVINQLNISSSTKECEQKNPLGSKCTTMISYGSAAVSVCGPFTITTWCSLAVKWAGEVQKACLNDGRVGGQIAFGSNIIQVIHSESEKTRPNPIVCKRLDGLC